MLPYKVYQSVREAERVMTGAGSQCGTAFLGSLGLSFSGSQFRKNRTLDSDTGENFRMIQN